MATAANESAAEPVPPPPSKEWTLEENSEYRFEVDSSGSIAIKLKKGGAAEIFGAEMAPEKLYVFGQECKAAVFSWSGCTLEVFGQPSSEYVSQETTMVPVANIALILEQRRLSTWNLGRPPGESSAALEDDTKALKTPPRVLIIGPESSGKTTLCKTLVNYGVRTLPGWTPILVNLDPSDGGWTVPGTISSCPISDPIQTWSPASALGSAASSAPVALGSSALLPLVFWFGHTELQKKVMLMERLIRNMGECVSQRTEDEAKARSSGIIVDTPPGIATVPGADKHKLLKACVEAFQINTILVIGHEKLTVDMQKLYGLDNPNMIILKIPKSGGVVEIDQLYHDRLVNHQLRTYMYGYKLPLLPGLDEKDLGGEGRIDMTLAPHSTTISFDDLTIYRIGEQSMAPSSALPIGAQRSISETQPIVVDPSQPGSGILNAVLALLAPPREESEQYDEQVLDLDVVGFLVVTGLDVEGRKMTVLSPSPGSLTGRKALIGTLEWQEL